MNLSKACLEELPGSLRELAPVIGLRGCTKLAEVYGGIGKLYIPAQMPPDHPLSSLLGWETARKLAEVYGGDYILSIPRCVDALRRARDREIVRMRSQGMTPPALARGFALTERQIWIILAKAKEEARSRQPQARLPGL